MSDAARPRWIVLLAVALVSLNLRMILASVPAVESDITAATGWSATVFGVLTTLPVLAMGVFALVVPRMAERIGRRHTVAIALLVITASAAMRLWAAVPGVLHVSALIGGMGIALAAGLVPAIVREQLSGSMGLATGLWTAAMMLGAAVAGALTAPLAAALGSWQQALALWALPAAMSLVMWWLVEERRAPGGSLVEKSPRQHVSRLRDLPWRNRHAWILTAYLLLNSVVFYSTLAWLAPSYVDSGLTQQDAGLLLGLFVTTQIPGALVMPPILERFPRRRWGMAAIVIVDVICLALLPVIPPSGAHALLAVFGFAIGANFAAGLAFLSEWAADADASARLTAMSFSVMFVISAFGPLLAGLAFDLTGTWVLTFTALAIISVAQLLTVPALRRGVLVH